MGLGAGRGGGGKSGFWFGGGGEVGGKEELFWGEGRVGGFAVPGLRDDDVVEGGVAFAEAREADFENHCWFDSWRGEEGDVWKLSFVELDRAEGVFFTVLTRRWDLIGLEQVMQSIVTTLPTAV